jgi:hypothetical protein
VTNPFNGPAPTYDQLKTRLCAVTGNAPGCIGPDLTRIDSPYMDIPYSYQTTIGMQRQLTETMEVTADYVQTRLKNTEIQRNVNLTYNPATGVNYPFTDLTRRAFPDWGLVNVVRFSKDGYQNDRGLQTALTKRFSKNWEMQGTYTVAWLKDAEPNPTSASIDPSTGYVQYLPLPFATAKDLGGWYTYSVADQRHRATLNGVWQLPHRFQLSGLYFYGSGCASGRPSALTSTSRHLGRQPFNRTTGRSATEQLRRQAASSRGHAHPSRLQGRQPRLIRRHRRSVQPVQPCELRQLRDDDRRGQLRGARRAGQRRVQTEAAAAGVQSDLLGDRSKATKTI